jgi:hypothetical protein
MTFIMLTMVAFSFLGLLRTRALRLWVALGLTLMLCVQMWTSAT